VGTDPSPPAAPMLKDWVTSDTTVERTLATRSGVRVRTGFLSITGIIGDYSELPVGEVPLYDCVVKLPER
jgi:hypothetical protein